MSYIETLLSLVPYIIGAIALIWLYAVMSVRAMKKMKQGKISEMRFFIAWMVWLWTAAIGASTLILIAAFKITP